MKLTWYGHACFGVESEGYRIVIDPYGDGEVPGLAPLRAEADEVLSSHGHSDHNAVSNVTLRGTGKASPFRVRTVGSVHDHHGGAHRGKNIIHVLEAEGLRIVHLGDQGCLLTREQIAQIGTPDAVLIPVGGFFTIDPAEALQVVAQLGPAAVIPMHYRGAGFGYDKIGPVEPFLEGADRPVRRLDCGEFELKKPVAREVIVPAYKA